ncbi:M1 family metallopeptidase [Sinimarinibacterium flocculans]|uniref:Aminopeptidase N n=1 Tax=Sinimarinibacterium flocculans TaxID=985250 RepID=A0A318EBW3_9GAMM|nr:M1 family metallopeptidase [Sinimarinibacterium flocculans]PXV64959.1 leukotriene A4 hydrolase-like protein [Sinimarinibacterium flocculans]
MTRTLCLTVIALMMTACATSEPVRTPASPAAPATSVATDPHSYANTTAFGTRHFELDLDVDFDRRVLSGHVVLQLDRRDAQAATLVLDTRDLDIRAVSVGTADGALTPTAFSLDARDPVLGSALRISLPPPADTVRIDYATQPQASGLQWLTPEQTTDKQHPFLFTQSQAIHARSWIPLQDTPQIRSSFEARIRTPKPLLAVMAAEMQADPARDGDYRFEMPQPIPSYLIALAVGDLRFQAMSERTAIYAEPSVVARAAAEFEDTEAMMQRSEAIYGPYRWGRYDLLILPSAFPYGGMENPRLTFATPTVIAGDKSLVSLVAHELAHSWSGNLVTNASWGDFWLNEGFTNHLTYRIMEEIFGADRGAQERALGANDLKETLARLTRDDDKTLLPDLAGRDPDDNVTDVPYERGALFLAYLEDRFGRDTFDAFLRKWFDAHAFQSVTTPQFLAFLDRELLQPNPGIVSAAQIDAWLRSPTMPADTVWPQSAAFAQVDAERSRFLGGSDTAQLAVDGWSTRQWQYFLDGMPEQLDAAQLQALDAAFDLSSGRNAAIATRWFCIVARNTYAPAYPQMEQHLKSIGRMLLIVPVYRELAKTEDGRALARRIYEEAHAGYHPIAQDAIAGVLGSKDA